VPPEQKEDCLFCNHDYQQIILGDIAYIKRVLNRYMIAAAVGGGVLVGLGVITIQNMNLSMFVDAVAFVAAAINGRY
jgi:hypothetical protein